MTYNYRPQKNLKSLTHSNEMNLSLLIPFDNSYTNPIQALMAKLADPNQFSKVY